MASKSELLRTLVADPAASSALKSVNAHPGLTTVAAVTQTFDGWIRPAACASIGVR
jgi:hypothetical protein